MEAHARAGIDIYGSTLRYAEVEQYGARYRLLRLGSCDFDFDVMDEVLNRDEGAQHLETVAEAMADVFSGSIADHVQVTLHPPGCYSFFTAIPTDIPDASRRSRLQQEAALLAGVDTPLRLTADAIYSEVLANGQEVDWVHVLAVPEDVYLRFTQILQALPRARRRLMVSMHATSNAAARVQALARAAEAPQEAEATAYTLAVGWYPTHIEFALNHGGRWRFSHYSTGGSPTDSAYFAVDLLRRLDLRPADVSRLFIYGSGIDLAAFSILRHVFPAEPERLNPLAVVDLDPGSLNAEFDVEAYASCVGAAL